jgi:hypothetical protein
MLWLPTVSEVVENEATPFTAVTVAIGVAASLNVTVPVGVTMQVTLAVKVTPWPGVEGLGAEVRLILVPAVLTVRVAEAVPPVPLSFEEIGSVSLTFVPVVSAVTFTLNVHELFAASVAPERLIKEEVATAEIAPPPQDPVRPFGVATASPTGRASVNDTPVSDVDEFGFEIVKVSDVVPPTVMLGVPKALLKVGGAMVKLIVTDGEALTLGVVVDDVAPDVTKSEPPPPPPPSARAPPPPPPPPK